MVTVKKISFISFCEHHLLPMVGKAHIAYFPRGNVIGLSALHRLVQHFAKRPQLQEKLTNQIADSLKNILNTEDVAVSSEATHYCVIARGIEDCQSTTLVHVLRGIFEKDPSLRTAFFNATNN